MITQKRLMTAVIASSLVAPLPVLAQLEEIIVTARKRDESIMKVPVVASVLGSDQIEQYQSGDLYQMAERVPGLVMSTGTLSFGSQLSLRGVGTSTLNTTLDQSVSLNIDGVQMTQGLAYMAGMFDMSQLEVLKGPQALFFGKASTGGVISFTTNDPGDEFELILRHGYETEAKQHRTDFIVSGPVSDTLGLRLAATYSDQDGWMRNEARAPRDPLPSFGAKDPKHRTFAPKEEWLVRGTALWTPTDSFSARFKLNVMRSDVDGDGGQTQFASCPDGVGAPFGIPFLSPNEDCRYDNVLRVVDLDPDYFIGIRNNGTPFNKLDQIFGTLELNYDINPELTLTSITGYYDIDQKSMINGTNSGFAATPLAADPSFKREDFTQEVRLTSNFIDNPLNFTVGGFYQDAEMTYFNNLLGNTALGLPAQLNLGYQPIDVRTYSLFGQLLWSITPELELTAGARWTDEERTHKIINTITGTEQQLPTATPKLQSDTWSPELALTYTPTDQLTVFAALKQAYKSGSFDTVTIGAPGQEVSFDDEKVRGGEVGIKTLLMDGRMQFNLAGYYYEYEDMQVGANETTPEGAVAIRTLNAANSEVYGVEFDFTYAPEAIEGLTLFGAANYNKAKFKDFDNAQCWGGQRIQDGCNRIFNEDTGLFTAQDLSGKPQLRAPEWTGNLGFDYRMPMDNGMALGLGWYTSYSDKFLTNLLARDDMWQGSYFTHNANISLTGANDAWEVALIGNNISDKLVRGNCVNSNAANGVLLGGMITGGAARGPAGVEELTCDVSNRRSIWLRFSMRFSSFMGT